MCLVPSTSSDPDEVARFRHLLRTHRHTTKTKPDFDIIEWTKEAVDLYKKAEADPSLSPTNVFAREFKYLTRTVTLMGDPTWEEWAAPLWSPKKATYDDIADMLMRGVLRSSEDPRKLTLDKYRVLYAGLIAAQERGMPQIVPTKVEIPFAATPGKSEVCTVDDRSARTGKDDLPQPPGAAQSPARTEEDGANKVNPHGTGKGQSEPMDMSASGPERRTNNPEQRASSSTQTGARKAPVVVVPRRPEVGPAKALHDEDLDVSIAFDAECMNAPAPDPPSERLEMLPNARKSVRRSPPLPPVDLPPGPLPSKYADNANPAMLYWGILSPPPSIEDVERFAKEGDGDLASDAVFTWAQLELVRALRERRLRILLQLGRAHTSYDEMYARDLEVLTRARKDALSSTKSAVGEGNGGHSAEEDVRDVDVDSWAGDEP
ncbi:hypothetical protein BV25DRAFT_1922317 [Artomyces pyxidatus]|uniref:Uncharacterized protein n=1 Tax=Artomyces pyxidatus TaxID=48021 RepID=A0ACB8SF34_9AGAM|nr:hypothetical protein BV25DRAFT_1922317 [Artomyces pyxidatus]